MTWMPANLCLVTLFTSEQCLQLERFGLQHIQMVNKTASFKTRFIDNNADASRVNCNIVGCSTFPWSRQRTSHYKLLLCEFWAWSWHPLFK